MLLTAKHILWPDGVGSAQMTGMVEETLQTATANKAVWLDERMDWQNDIMRICFEYGINPAWVLISLQRERGLMTKEGDVKDFDFATGFVGCDNGTVNPRWNGLPLQIWLAARGAAWLSNRGPVELFGWRPGIAPTVPRWVEGGINRIQLLDAAHAPAGVRDCTSVEEFVQLSYTPHVEVLVTNGSILESRCPLFI